MPAGEVEELISLLSEASFTFQNVQEHALTAKLEGSYKDVWLTVSKLMDKGFYWSEEAKKLEEKGEVASREELKTASRIDVEDKTAGQNK